MKRFYSRITMLAASVFAFASMNAQTCGAPTTLVSGVQLTGESTCGLGNNITDGCGRDQDEDAIYTYTVGAGGAEDITVDVTGLAENWAGVSIISGTCGDVSGGAVCEGNAQNTSSTGDLSAFAGGIPAGTTIWVHVDSWINSGGDCLSTYDIELTAVPAVAPPTCATAIDVSAGGTFASGIINGTLEDMCGAPSSPTAANWFVYHATADGTLDVSSCGGPDTYLAIGTGTCGSLTSVSCVDDNGVLCSGSAASASIPVTNGTSYYITWVDSYSTTDFNFDVTFTLPPTCQDPTGLAATSVTASSLSADWTSANTGAGETYNVYVVLDGATPTTADATGSAAAGANSVAITTYNGGTALLANTDYDLYVEEDCALAAGGTSTLIGPVSFSTPCAVYTPDYDEDFTSFLPDCWDEADGGDAGTGPTGIGSGPWTSSTALGTGSARINLYNASHSDWLLSPEFDLSSGGFEVVVDVAVTNWNSGAADAMGSDDAVTLLMTEDGSTWSSVASWTAADALANTPTQFSYPLVSTGANVQFGILATDGPTDDSEDYDFHVANFKVQTPPACPDVSGLMAMNLSLTNVDISWTAAAGATNYLWEIQDAPNAQGTPGAVASGSGAGTSASAAGSYVEGNDYILYVVSECPSQGTYQSLSFTLNIPPANDECAAAIALTVNADLSCGVQTPGTIEFATASAEDASACSGTEDDDVWFSFVATATSHEIDLNNVTSGTTDLYHSVWEGTCGSLSLVPGTCSDPNSSSPSGLTIGNTYYLRVYSWTSTPGQTTDFDVCIGTLPPPPANDDCAGAVGLTVNPDLACGTVTSGTLASATASPESTSACSGTENDDVWFSFVATATSHEVSLNNITNSPTDLYHSLWEGGCGSLTLVPGTCSDPNSSSPSGLTIGNTYYLRVYSWSSSSGATTNFDVCIGTPPPPPSNDDCADAIAITPSVFGVSGWTSHSTDQSTQSLSGCVGTADDDIWFSFEAQSPNDAVMVRGESGASFDGVVEIYEGGCPGTAIMCEDSHGSSNRGLERALPGNLTVGDTYMYRVYHYFSGNGTGSSIETQVKTFHDGGVRATDCGETYELSQSIYAERDDLGQLYSNPGVPVKGYRFLFEEQGGGLVQYVAHVNEAPYMALSDVPGLEYGKTYDVSVSHRVKMAANGTVDEYWSAYGTPCPITIQATIPTTQLKAAFCNNGDYYLEQQIQAVAVPGASQYRFTFTEGGNTFTELSNNYAVSLYNVGPFGGPGLEYANVYTVTVEAFINGAWSAPGTACTIGMHSQPEATGLQSSYCNGTYIYPQNPNYLLAQPVLGAEYYEWRMTPVGGGVAQTQTTTGISLAMHLTSLDLSAGGDWDVEVRAFAGGTLGDYGASCPVTIDTGIGAAQPSGNERAAVKLLSTSKLSQMIYPNPNDGNEFRVNIEGLSENGTAQMILRDLQGRLLEVKTYTYTEKTDFIWRTSATLEAGIYILETQVGQESMTTLFTVR